MVDSPIEEIKSRMDIVDVIGSYIKLQKTGQNYRALCPFHKEKTPSFFVSPARQMFKCFGCGVFGDIFNFVMLIEGVEFGDALRILAKRAGVQLTKQSPELKSERQRLYEICELSSSFFEKQLNESPIGEKAKEYLLERKLTENSIKKWRLGYAPDDWQSLSDFLVGRGYQRKEIAMAGLAVKSSNAQNPAVEKYYDRFRGRIIFPIFDFNSQIIGFGGRILDNYHPSQNGETAFAGAKYINISNTLLYNKSRALYGLNFAKAAIREKDSCVLVEGYMDVIFSHQAGVFNTVAASGTSLTFDQLKIIKRYTPNLLMAFDMDFAGGSATKRGINLAREEDFNIKIITMPKGADPADVISKNAKDWKKLIAEAKGIEEFYFDNALSSFDKKTPEGKKEISKFLLPKIKKIPNKILQFHWIQKLASTLKVSEEAVIEELKKIIPDKNTFSKERETNGGKKEVRIKKSREEMLEEKILSLALKNPESLNLIEKPYLPLLFSPPIGAILSVLRNNYQKIANKKGNIKKELEKIAEKAAKGEQEKKLLVEIFFRIEAMENEEAPEEEMETCLSQLKNLRTKEKLEAVSREIQKAEFEKDSGKMNNLVQKFNQLAKNLTNSQNNGKK